MPFDNAFRPQTYSAEQPRATYKPLQPELPTELARTDTCILGQSAGQWLHNAGVQRIVLVHGTFTGNDALGLVRGLERIVPSAGDRLRQVGQAWVDWLARDVGHYTDQYVARFHELLGAHRDAISVGRFVWSGENHHVGRADAAIRLIDHLLHDAGQDRRRVLLWGHSHAGNVFALVTNLLASPLYSVQRFFAACRPLFFSSQVSQSDQDRWQRVRHLLIHRRNLVEALQLDIVTFGTPIRYGWESRGYRQLLHVVHHRPADGLPVYLVPFPFSWDDMFNARYGDYVQQIGIAGTDFPPSLVTWRAMRVQSRLHRLLEAGYTRRTTLRRLKCGMRVANEGTVLLVDYPLDDTEQREQLLGHAIYTHQAWLPYHLLQVVHNFYVSE